MAILLIAAALVGASADEAQPGPRGRWVVCTGASSHRQCRPQPPAVACGSGTTFDPATESCMPVSVPVQNVPCPGGVSVPQGQACPSLGPWIVYFDADSTAVSTQAGSMLDFVAAQYRAADQCTDHPLVTLTGHTDRSGSDASNVRLSQRYANAVRDYLVAHGVPASAITTQAFGESRPAVDTEDGVREALNRRVEISFGLVGGGW